MARWAPQKNDILEALAAEILHNYGKGRVIIAVDGLGGADKPGFADALGEVLGRGSRAVYRASIEDFHRPRAERLARGEDSAEGFYLDSYNYRTFRRILTDPFRIGSIGSFVLRGFDLDRNAEFEPKWTTGPDDAILIIDGIFLNRPELKGIWNYSIWLSVEGEPSAGERLYLEDAKPQDAANAIIDANDPEHPRRVFSDSC
jgi:uridine kinase